MSKLDPRTPYPRMQAFPARHFGWHEVRCHHCIELDELGFPERKVLEGEPFRSLCKVLDSIRGELGKPVLVNSWYRCPEHPLEAKKPRPGVHAHGLAADLRLKGIDVAVAVQAAMRTMIYSQSGPPSTIMKCEDILGFGFQQSGSYNERYLHVDVGGFLPEFKSRRGNTWTY